MEKALKKFMSQKEPTEAVRIYADAARRRNRSLNMEQSIELGKKQAHTMYTQAGEHVKAWKVEGVTLSETILSRCSRPLRRFSEDDVEPGDSGSNHDDYVAAKQARRNGLRK